MPTQSIITRANSFIDRLIMSPVSAAFGILAAVTTIWGLVAIYRDLLEFSGTQTAAVGVVTLLGLCAAPVLLAIFLPSFRKRFHLPDGERYIYTTVERDWEIFQDGSAVVETRKTFLFFAEPDPVDLSDTAFSSDEFTVDELAWASEDAIIHDHEQLNARMHRVFWRPRQGSVQIGEPYTHHVRARYASHVARPLYKVMTIAAPATALALRVKVRCADLPIQQAIAYRGSVRQRLNETDEIAARAKKIRRKNAPAPLLKSPHEVEWTLTHLTPGSTYFLVLFFPPVISDKPGSAHAGE